MDRKLVALGAAFAFLGVAMGAFGTHAMRDRVSPADLEIWRTGVQYHLVHALAILIVAGLGERFRNSAYLFAVGIAIFSGSLYLLVATGTRFLGAITPIGGLCLLVGWLLVVVRALRTDA